MIKVPGLSSAGVYSLFVTSDGTEKLLDSAFIVANTQTHAIASVSPRAYIAPSQTPDFRVIVTVYRSIFPAAPPYSAVVSIATALKTFDCVGVKFTDVPFTPLLVALSCVPAYSSTAATVVDAPAEVTVKVGVTSYSSTNAMSFLGVPELKRVDPAPALAATTEEPRALTLLFRSGTYAGTAPLCVRITPSLTAATAPGSSHRNSSSCDSGGDDGTVKIDDAATVYAPDFITVYYTSDTAAPGPADITYGVFDAAGACLPMLTVPSALTITAGAPPPLQPVLAVYPREMAPEAQEARALITIHVPGPLPAKLSVSVGTAEVDVVERGSRGVIVRFSNAPTTDECLASIVIRDADTGVAVAHAPTLFQTLQRRHSHVVDAAPPALFASPTPHQRFVKFRISFAWDVIAVRVRHGGADVSGTLTTSYNLLWVSFNLAMIPGVPVRFDFYQPMFDDGTSDGEELCVSYELPVIDASLLALSPSSLVCAPGDCKARVVATFAALPPFPFLMKLGESMWHPFFDVGAAGTVTIPDLDLTGDSMGSVRLQLFSRNLLDNATQTLGVEHILNLDIIVDIASPYVTATIPASAVVAARPQNVLVQTSKIHGVVDDYDVSVGPYLTKLSHRGSFYFLFDIIPPANGAPFAAGPHNFSVVYRGEPFFTYANVFTFTAPATEDAPAGDRVSPLWFIASSVVEEFSVTGRNLAVVSRVRLVRSGFTVPIETDRVTLVEGGALLKFAIAVPDAGTYSVYVRTQWGKMHLVGAVVAAETPRLQFVTPNSTIPFDEKFVSAVLRARFAQDTAVSALPLEYYAVHEVDGTEVRQFAITHTSQSNVVDLITLAWSGAEDIAPGDYRLGFRSLLASDVTVTEREFGGSGAVFSFDDANYVMVATAVIPSEVLVGAWLLPDPKYRNIVLILKNAKDAIPDQRFLRAAFDDAPAEVLHVSANTVVLRLPETPLKAFHSYDIALIDTRTNRAAVSAIGALTIWGSTELDVLIVGFTAPRVYVPARTASLTLGIAGSHGMDQIDTILVGAEPCNITHASPTLVECVLAASSAAADRISAKVMAHGIEVGAPVFDVVSPILAVKVVTASRVDGNTVDVVLLYECARNLAKLPFSLRLRGATGFITHVFFTDRNIFFTAHRTGGSRLAYVELFDVGVSPDPDTAETFFVFDAATFTFHKEANILTWAFALMGAASLAACAAAAFAIKRRVCPAKEDGDDGNNDDHDDYYDEDGDAASTVRYEAVPRECTALASPHTSIQVRGGAL